MNESDILIATPKSMGNRVGGTWGTIFYAKRKGVPVTIIRPDGVVDSQSATPPEPEAKR